MTDAWLGFIGGILATLVGALVASLVQRQNEIKKRKEQAHVDAYFHLIDLSNWYGDVPIAVEPSDSGGSHCECYATFSCWGSSA